MDKELLERISGAYGREFSVRSDTLELTFTAKSGFTLVDDESGKGYIIKKLHPAYFQLTQDKDYFKGLQTFLTHLRRQDIPIINYLENQRGEIFYTEDGAHYLVMPFVEGSLYTTEDAEIQAIARLHGRVNKVLETLPKSDQEHIAQHCKNPFLMQDIALKKVLRRVKLRIAELADSESLELLKEIALPLVEKHLDIIPDEVYHALPKQVAHKDIFPGNVFFQGANKQAFLLDPDAMLYLPRIRDVAYGIWSFAVRQPPKLGVHPPNIDQAQLYLEYYLKEGTLTTKEISLLAKTMIRIWIEDVLHYALISDFTDADKVNVKRKITHLKNAVEAEHEFRFEQI